MGLSTEAAVRCQSSLPSCCKMVGSSPALLAFFTVLAFASTGNTNPCDKANSIIRSYTYQLTNDSCIYIRRQEPPIDWESAKNACESLYPYPLKWRLLEPKTQDIHGNFKQVAAKVTTQSSWVWIGLVRDKAKGLEDLTADGWADPSKWRWTSDNATLLSFQNSSVPWYNNPPGGGEGKRCVAALMQVRSVTWLAENCSQWYPNQFLACESMDISTTTRSTTTTTTTKTPATNAANAATQATSEFEYGPWIWGLLAFVIVAGIVAVVVLIGRYGLPAYRKWRRERAMFSYSSDASGSYVNVRPKDPNRKRKPKPPPEPESELDSTATTRSVKLGRRELQQKIWKIREANRKLDHELELVEWERKKAEMKMNAKEGSKSAIGKDGSKVIGKVEQKATVVTVGSKSTFAKGGSTSAVGKDGSKSTVVEMEPKAVSAKQQEKKAGSKSAKKA